MGPDTDGGRWKPRRLAAAALGGLVALFPVGCAVGAAIGVRVAVPAPASIAGFALWWVGTIALSTVAFVTSDRLARRLLPLAVLLKMDMAFPGRAPRRLAVARRAGSVRDLDRRVAEARTRGFADEPTVAAERIVALAATLSAHDRTTRGHAERVRALTDLVADELRLSPIDRDRLRWSALLHDIGKLTVHPHVLNKPDKLNDAEWEIVRRHPLEGARLTAPIAGWLGPWAQTIAEHHERFDGRGYPYGLSGRQISLGGRIVAVVDSYDVMTSMRSYKKPVSPDEARRELAACAGSQFDPDVVRAFLAVSLWRLRLAAPLSWLGSATATKAAGAVARVGAVSGHSVGTAIAAGAAVVGLTAATPLASGTAAPHATVVDAPVAGHSANTTTPTAPSSDRGPAHGTSSSSSSHGGATGTTPTSAHGSSATTTTVHGSATTTTVHGSATTTTAVHGSSATTTTTSTATTTTTTTTPPPLAPSALSASGQCQLLVIGPEIVLSWTASPTPSVTSSTVLRKSGAGAYAAIAQVSAATTSYADTSVAGVGKTYTYEIRANAPSGAAASGPASATTPTLCL